MQDFLKGITVIDVSHLLPGTLISSILGDMGAEVIKVESPGKKDKMRSLPPFVDGKSVYFLSVGRNRKSLVLDYLDPEGREVFNRVLKRADVFFQSFRPESARKLGFDYDSITSVNGSIVYSSVGGYGETGKFAERAGHDINFIARSGLFDFFSGPDRKPGLPGLQPVDQAGVFYAVAAILGALLKQSRGGDGGKKGEKVEIPLLDAAVSLGAFGLSELLADERLQHVRDAPAFILDGRMPCYTIYETADAGHLAVGCIEHKFWQRFTEIIERPDLEGSQFDSSGEVFKSVQEKISKKSADEWALIFENEDICVEKIASPQEALKDGDLMSRRLVSTYETPGLEGFRYIRNPIHSETTANAPDMPPPSFGEHTRTILSESGLSDAEIQDLFDKGIALQD